MAVRWGYIFRPLDADDHIDNKILSQTGVTLIFILAGYLYASENGSSATYSIAFRDHPDKFRSILEYLKHALNG